MWFMAALSDRIAASLTMSKRLNEISPFYMFIYGTVFEKWPKKFPWNYRRQKSSKTIPPYFHDLFWVVFKHFAKGAQNKISTYSTTNGRITNSDLSSKKYTRKKFGLFSNICFIYSAKIGFGPILRFDYVPWCPSGSWLVFLSFGFVQYMIDNRELVLLVIPPLPRLGLRVYDTHVVWWWLQLMQHPHSVGVGQLGL